MKQGADGCERIDVSGGFLVRVINVDDYIFTRPKPVNRGR